MKCTWITKSAGEGNSGDTVVGGEVQVSFTAKGPDRDKLCH